MRVCILSQMLPVYKTFQILHNSSTLADSTKLQSGALVVGYHLPYGVAAELVIILDFESVIVLVDHNDGE